MGHIVNRSYYRPDDEPPRYKETTANPAVKYGKYRWYDDCDIADLLIANCFHQYGKEDKPICLDLYQEGIGGFINVIGDPMWDDSFCADFVAAKDRPLEDKIVFKAICDFNDYTDARIANVLDWLEEGNDGMPKAIFIPIIRSSHFTMLLIQPQIKQVFFFNSFGTPAPMDYEGFFQNKGYDVDYSKEPLQQDGTSCGPSLIYFFKEAVRCLQNNLDINQENLNLLPFDPEQRDKMLKENADMLVGYNNNFAFLLFVKADVLLRKEINLDRRGQFILRDTDAGVDSENFIFNPMVCVDADRLYTINGHAVDDLQQQTLMEALSLYYEAELDIDVVYYHNKNESKKCQVILQNGEYKLEEIEVKVEEPFPKDIGENTKNKNYNLNKILIITSITSTSAVLGLGVSYCLKQQVSSFLSSNFNIEQDVAEIIFAVTTPLVFAAVAAMISIVVIEKVKEAC